MADSSYALSVMRTTRSDGEEFVHVRVTGPFELPLSSDALNAIEQAAYFMSFSRPRGIDRRFIIYLPEGLSNAQCVLIDNAIFRGLITRGDKGSWSSLYSYPD
jgi:hypothetical protein